MENVPSSFSTVDAAVPRCDCRHVFPVTASLWRKRLYCTIAFFTPSHTHTRRHPQIVQVSIPSYLAHRRTHTHTHTHTLIWFSFPRPTGKLARHSSHPHPRPVNKRPAERCIAKAKKVHPLSRLLPKPTEPPEPPLPWVGRLAGPFLILRRTNGRFSVGVCVSLASHTPGQRKRVAAGARGNGKSLCVCVSSQWRSTWPYSFDLARHIQSEPQLGVW